MINKCVPGTIGTNKDYVAIFPVKLLQRLIADNILCSHFAIQYLVLYDGQVIAVDIPLRGMLKELKDMYSRTNK